MTLQSADILLKFHRPCTAVLDRLSACKGPIEPVQAIKSVPIKTMPAELPGFVWDDERKRYFRVLNSGLAPVTQSGAHAARNSIASGFASMKKATMQDYTIAKMGSAHRARERRRVSTAAKNLGLVENDNMFRPAEPFAQFGLRHRNSNVVDRIASLKESNGFLFGVSEGGMLTIKSITTSACSRAEKTGSRYFSGMDIHAQLLAVSTQEISADVSYGHVFDLRSAEPTATHKFTETVNCMALSETGKFIAGCDRGFYIGDKFQKTDSGVTALGRLKSGIVAGSRSGECWNIDERSPTPSFVTRHFSCVTNVVPTSTGIIVSGIEDRLARYDLRSPQHPVVEYPCYQNSSTLKHGIAVDKRVSVLAVAMDDGQVGLWDVETSRTRPAPKLAFANGEAFPCLLWSTQDLYVAHQSEVYKLTGEEDEFSRRVAELRKRSSTSDPNAFTHLLDIVNVLA